MNEYKTIESKNTLTPEQIEEERKNGWQWVSSEPQIVFETTKTEVLPANNFKHRFLKII